jgi:hypothetical protein
MGPTHQSGICMTIPVEKHVSALIEVEVKNHPAIGILTPVPAKAARVSIRVQNGGRYRLLRALYRFNMLTRAWAYMMSLSIVRTKIS